MPGGTCSVSPSTAKVTPPGCGTAVTSTTSLGWPSDTVSASISW